MAGYIGDVEAVDDYTLKADLIIPGYATLMNFLAVDAMTRVDCEEVVEAAGGIVTDWHDVVSVGPWILTDFVTGSQATYEGNPDFWDYDERYPENKLPYADKLNLVCIPDVATAMAALRTGQVDFLENMLLTQSQTLAKSNPELLQAAMPAGARGLSMRTDMEPFSDLRVRKAVSMSINREELANVYYQGQADPTPAGAALPAMDCCYAYDEWPQSLKDEYAYNVAGARAELADAGYPDGFECSMWMQNTDDLQLAEIVKAYLLDIGIDATIEVTDGASLNGMISAREYDGIVFGNGTGAGTLPQLSARFYSKDFFLNSSVVNSPEYDAIHDKFAQSATREEAIVFIKEMDKMGIEQHWVTSLPCIYNFNIYQPYLKGYNGEAVNGNGMGGYNPARWWIDQALQETMK
jgi:peptide/nickel transport system substrate-binding protein